MKVSQTSDVSGQLWTVATQLQGLSELFRAVRGDSEPFSECACCGIGYLIADMVAAMDAILDAAENAPDSENENDLSERKPIIRRKKR